MRTVPPHTHQWINPADPPIARQTYVPVVGPLRHQMKAGVQYECRECGSVVLILADNGRLSLGVCAKAKP